MAASIRSQIATDSEERSTLIEDTEKEIERQLHFTQHAALRHVGYRIDEGTVVLYGRVPSYYLKQLAQVKVTGLPGVERVENRIEVAVS